jgi:signal transduction histidine kinase
MAANCRAAGLASLTGVLLFLPAFAQVWPTTLEQAGSRIGPDFMPAFEGQEVLVMGQASAKALWAGGTYFLPIQDLSSFGLILQGEPPQFAAVRPGDWLQVRGTIREHAGLPTLLPTEIQRMRVGAPPDPRPIQVDDLNSFRYLGVLVRIELPILAARETAGADVLVLGTSSKSIDAVLPKFRQDAASGLEKFRRGDRVRVTGIAAQSSVVPPYDRFFQILLAGAEDVVPIANTALVPGWLPLTFLGFACGTVAIWWSTIRRRSEQGQRILLMNQAADEALGAASAAELVTSLNAAFAKILPESRLVVYLYSRSSRTLESIAATGNGERVSIGLEAAAGAVATGAQLCFRNRTFLTVPDTRRNSLFQDARQDAPQSLLFAPMLARGEAAGVLELSHPVKLNALTPDERLVLQHVANLTGAALRLLEQKAAREQLFRSEKLAAAGQLISGAAGELRTPLGAILDTVKLAKARVGRFDPELDSIESEARRAFESVDRLLAFGKGGPVDAQPVDIHAVLAAVLRFRSTSQREKETRIHRQFANHRIEVLGSRGQLEQAFLNLVVYAEQAAAELHDIAMSISTSLLARKVLVEIGYHTASSEGRKTDPFDTASADPGALSLALSRGIIQSHGGDIRLVRVSPSQSRFEVELPVSEAVPMLSAAAAGVELAPARRRLTVLVVEPDAQTRKRVLDVLGTLGDRVVPVTSGEEAADLAQRLPFDFTICSARLPGLNWVEYFERVKQQVHAFVLLTQGYDADLSRAFQGGEGFVLNTPIDDAQLIQVRERIEARLNRPGV